MNPTDSVVISRSKGRVWLLVLGCVLFVVLGFFFILKPQDFRSPLFHYPLFIRILGFIALIFFGYFLGAYIPYLKDVSPGLVIDEQGVVDHSTDVSVGRIDWQDITEVYSRKIAGNKFVILKVSNPEEYISRADAKMEKKGLQGNLKLCGSPIAISAATLKCKFKELDKLLTDAFQQYRKEE